MNIGPFELVNEEKVFRATYGTVGKGGVMVGGVGEGADEAIILAEYDRLGGLVHKDGEKVKTGSFYDLAARKPRETPEVVLLYSVNGKIIEVPEGHEVPLAVRAARIAEGQEPSADETLDEKPTKNKKKAPVDE